HRRSDGLALIVGGTGLPGTGLGLVRVLVRMARHRGLAWSVSLVRFWSAGLDLRTNPATRHEADPCHLAVWRAIGQAGTRAPVVGMVRVPAGVVRCWPAVRSACCCGTDDPDQQLIAAHQADRRPG